jgi:hypothetical protein
VKKKMNVLEHRYAMARPKKRRVGINQRGGRTALLQQPLRTVNVQQN